MQTKLIARAALMLALPVAASAHHSFAAFDMSKNITIEGTVVDYKLENPHAHMSMKVESVDGKAQPKVVTWDVEGAAANIMRRQGWSAQTLKPGDKVKFVGHPLHSGDAGLSLFYVILPDGKHIYQDISRPTADSKLP